MNKTIKFKGLEYTEDNLIKIIVNKKYLIKYKSIYQISYSTNAGFQFLLIYKNNSRIPLTKRGRHIFADAKQVNELLGISLLVED